jgi:small GTP-binding protein
MLKVVTVGESGVGKTSIVNKYLNYSGDVAPTVGAFSLQIPVRVSPTTEIVLNVWDTAGQEQFRAMIPLYLRNARACLYVFDCSNPPSVVALENAIADLRPFLDPNTLIFVCGNKRDLVEDLEPMKEFVTWAREKRIPFCQTSAVSGEGIGTLFQMMASKLVDYRTPLDVDAAPMSVDQTATKGCC